METRTFPLVNVEIQPAIRTTNRKLILGASLGT
jgi:hypothetical protein